jgi:hypothetical protein
LSISCFGATEAPDWLTALTKTAPTVSTKDASAVRLLDEGQMEIQPDGRRTMRIRQALKILTADGKKHATANVNYLAGSSEVKSFKAWVIKPNGEVTALGKKGLRDIALHASALELYSEARRQILSAAADIQPGSWFGFEAVRVERTIFHELTWHFQDDIPMQRSSITVKLPEGWTVVDRTLNHAPIASTGSPALRTWQMTEVAALPQEPMSPAAVSFAPYLALDFIPPPKSAVARSAVKSGSWLELSRQFTPKYDAASEADDAMRQRVAKLLTGADTPWERLQRLCHFAQTVNYISIQLDAGNAGGMIPRPAARVLQCNYGDCKDKANLLRTLLAIAGIKAHPLAVLAGARERIESDWPSPSQFNHVILAIPVDAAIESAAIVEHPQLGRLLLFDPTDEYTPLGLVASSRLARQGLLLAGDAGGLIELPRAKVESEQLKRSIRAEVDSIGNIHAILDEEFTGLASSAARGEFNRLKKDDFQKRIEHWLGSNLPALRGTNVESKDGFPTAAFALHVEFSSFGYGKMMRDELLIFKPVLVARRDTARLPKKERKLPVALRANAFEERAEFALPEGYAVEELPRAALLETDFGRYQMQARQDAGKIVFERSLVMQSVEVPAADYEKVRAFFEKVHQSEQSPIVLRRVSAPPSTVRESDLKKTTPPAPASAGE